MNGSILLVDDEPHITKALQRELRTDGYQIYCAESGPAGLELLAQIPIDVVISDQRMPSMSGAEFLGHVQGRHPDTIRILLSGYSDFQGVVDAINHGAIYKFWSKPWNSQVLRQQVREAVVESRRLQRDKQQNYMLDTAIEGVVTTDAEGRIESANAATEVITGYAGDELLEQNFFRDCIHFKQGEGLQSILQSVNEQGDWKGQLNGIRKNGSVFIQQLSITGFRNRLGRVSHLGILLLDVTEQKEQQVRAEFLAHHDETTGLPNRRLLNDRLTQALKSLPEQGNYHVALLSLDTQRFDSLLENLGRNGAGRVLKMVAERLQTLVSELATVACFGSAQFAVLLPQVTDKADAEQQVLSILKGFEQSLHIDGVEFYLRFNLGLALTGLGDGDADALIKQADTARQQARENNKPYCVHAASMDDSLHERWLLEHALPKALESNELSIVYQPKIGMNSGRVEGMEALLRWRHPEWGVIPPDKFIAIAEETGLIVELGKWCLYTACEQAKIWHSQGYNQLRLAVNLSPRQMKDNDLCDMVESTLVSLNYQPHLLELEITESSLLSDDVVALELMRKLRQLGVGLAADDFGTGYASIDYIKRFPFSTLKIDRSFITELASRESDTTILESIFMMARSLGLKVVAEGVESKDQYELLREKGCDMIQGYLFSKPLAVEHFSAFLKNSELSQGYPELSCSN